MTGRSLPTTITDLVLEPPLKPKRPRPVGMRLALMKAEPMPASFYRYLYGEVGRDFMWVDRHGLNDAELAALIAKPGIEITVLYANGAPAGFFELDCADMVQVDLAYFGIVPAWSGRGIGPWLLGCAIDEAFARKTERMTVCTCTFDHPKALVTYQRCGFRPVGQRHRELAVPEGFAMPRHVLAELS